MENSVVFDIKIFIFFMVVLENYLKKKILTVKLLNTQEGSLTVKLTACSSLYGWQESHFGPQLSDHNRLAPYYQSFVGQQ